MRYFFITFVSTLLLAAGINLYVDPLATWASHPFQELPIPADHIYTGKEINERLLKKTMLELDSDASTFLLGTSRVMTWGSSHFSNPAHVLNLGVTDATSEDYSFFLDHLKLHSNIKQIYIEIAPWTFQDKCNHWIQVSEYQTHRNWNERFKQIQDLFTYTILKESLTSIARKESSGKVLPVVGNEHEHGYFYDGRRHYSDDYLKKTLLNVKSEALNWSKQSNIEHLECGISEKKIDTFCNQLTYLQKTTNAEIRLLYLPWNPISKAELNRRRKETNLESINHNLSKALNEHCAGIAISDFTDLCPSEEFLDAMHPRENCFFRVAEGLKVNHKLN